MWVPSDVKLVKVRVQLKDVWSVVNSVKVSVGLCAILLVLFLFAVTLY